MLSIKNKKLLKFAPDYKLNLITLESIREEEFDRFKTGLGMAMQYIKHQNDDVADVIIKNRKFERLDRETANLINTVTGSKLEFEETKGEVNMCRALENFREKAKQEGKIEGKIEGEKTGENKMYQLIKQLIKDNR